MQPQDLLIALLLMVEQEPLQQKDIADRLGISRSAVSYAMARLVSLKLLSEDRKRVMKQTILDFIKYAIAIVYPANLGAQVRGIPTARDFHLFDNNISFYDSTTHDMTAVINSYVWKHESGEAIGQSIQPIYPSVPEIIMSEPELYEVLNLIDVMRIGNSRERRMAYEALEDKLQSK